MSSWYMERFGHYIDLSKIYWLSPPIEVKEGYWQVQYKITDVTSYFTFKDEHSAKQFVESVLRDERVEPGKYLGSEEIKALKHVGNLL